MLMNGRDPVAYRPWISGDAVMSRNRNKEVRQQQGMGDPADRQHEGSRQAERQAKRKTRDSKKTLREKAPKN